MEEDSTLQNVKDQKQTMSTHNYFPLLPIVSSIVQLILLLSSYTISSWKRNTWIPALNKLPTCVPNGKTTCNLEKGLFILALGLGAMMNFAVMLLRYIQINSIYPKNYKKMNMASFACGIIMLLQRVSVPAFPLTYSQMEFEASSAIYIFFSIVFVLTQTFMSKKLYWCHGRKLATFRILSSAVTFVCFVGYIVGRTMKFLLTMDEMDRVTGTAEMAFDLSIILYVTSFCCDFKEVRFRSYSSDKRSSISGTNDANVNKGFNYVDYLRNQAKTRKSFGHIMDEMDSDAKF